MEVWIKRTLWVLLACVLVYGVLINPDNPVTRLLRGEISDVDANIIIGPYPVEADFERLRKNNVGTIISLLNPDIPYEKVLLDKESGLASRFQIRLLNFPMISILGQKMGQSYENNAQAAAEAAAKSAGKVYMHCYLGIHRVMSVKKILDQGYVKTGRYVMKSGERSEHAIQQDKADELYHQGYYAEAANVLADMPELSPAARLLYGWALYHQGKIAEARVRFNSADNSTEKSTGLAYCDLRDNKLDGAQAGFSHILAAQPANESALHGMGIVFYRQGKMQESTAYLEKVLRINPDNTEAAKILTLIREDSAH